MRKPFDIQYRPQIESGEYKVESRDGRPARIICWDMDSYNSIVALLANTKAWNGKEQEYIISCTKAGLVFPGAETSEDLFIVIPGEELSEFEIRLLDWLSDDTSGEIPMERMKEVVRNRAAELLSLAREQFIKDGYVIEKKAFHDAVEKVSSEVMKEVSVKKDEIFERRRQTLPTSGEVEGIVKSATDYMRGFSDGASTYIPKDMKEALRAEYEKGKADALKDLPRWKLSTYCFDTSCLCNGILFYKSHAIPLKALEELPGFKED